MFDIHTIIRPTIKSLKAYHVWRDDYLDQPGAIFLDNCENNFGSPLGKGFERYPASSQQKVKQAIAELKQLTSDQVVLGNGSDELIDILIRATCEPQHDKILICEPTFGMFSVYAQLNAVDVVNIPLQLPDFSWDTDGILSALDDSIKLIFICSPNNPTGTSIQLSSLKKIADRFNGLLVVDEAYIDFSNKASALTVLTTVPNLVVLQTFSKAWGLAALRLGVAYASKEIAEVLNGIRPPFNVSSYTQSSILKAVALKKEKEKLVQLVLKEKDKLKLALVKLPFVKRIIESDANFFLIEVENAGRLYSYLLQHHVLISNRSSLLNCTNHVRISIGTENENTRLLELLNTFV